MRENLKCSHPAKPVVVVLSTLAASVGALVSAFVSNDHDRDGGNSSGASGRWASSVAGFYVPAAAKRAVDLAHGWIFRVGDDSSWSEVDADETDWSAIKVDETWEAQGFDDIDGLAWYRCHFAVDREVLADPLFLRLGRVDDADEVWVNGRRIGGTGEMHAGGRTAWASERVYAIPAGLLKADTDNLVAVRVYDERLGGGMVEGRPAILTQNLPQPLLDLAGTWKLSPADDARLRLPDASDDTFDNVVVPGVWDDQGRADFDGHLWYRKHFTLAPRVGETLVLLLGVVDDEDEVYLNGELIGHTLQSETDGEVWQMPRAYSFAGDMLRDGEQANVIAVRVNDVRGHGGIVAGPVGVMTAADHAVWSAEGKHAMRSWSRAWDWLLGRG